MIIQTRQWLVMLGGTGVVSALNVIFTPQRSRIKRVKLTRLIEPHEYPGTATNGIALIPVPEVAIGVAFVCLLDVTYTEDAPQIASIAWECSTPPDPKAFSYALPIDVFVNAGLVTPPEQGKPAPPLDFTGEISASLKYLWQHLLAPRAIPIEIIGTHQRTEFLRRCSDAFENIYTIRRQALDLDDRTRRFFLALDVGSAGRQVSPEWLTALVHVNNKLAMRVNARSVAARLGRVPIWAPSKRFARPLRDVSMFVQTLILTHLVDADQKSLVDWAFTRFAVESLAVSHPEPCRHALLRSHGAPDGEAFFRFAELALACIEQGVHVDFWTTHLETLVRTAHIYAEHGAERNVRFEYIYAYKENRRYPIPRLAQVGRLYAARPASIPAHVHYGDLFTSVLWYALRPNTPPPFHTRPLVSRAEFARQNTDFDLATETLQFFETSQLFKFL
ncbi:MAG: hypothetical protein JNL28_06300 [Planctomycetes bacterium]|nr:hypothetical protein [Planctomycetota bacterium]